MKLKRERAGRERSSFYETVTSKSGMRLFDRYFSLGLRDRLENSGSL